MSITPKGEARRTALLDAVVRVLERDGARAVTHRAVAAEAGVPVSAATYYFTDLDDLYVSALRRATAEQITIFDGIAEASITEFAAALHGWIFGDRGSAIAQYELMFLAMRRDGLREDAERWYRALEHSLDPQKLHPERTRVIVMAVDGLLLRMLWLGTPGTVEETERALREIVSRTT